MLNTPCICLISIVVAICVIGLILLIVFCCLNKNKRYNNYRTFGGADKTFEDLFEVCKKYLKNHASDNEDKLVDNYILNITNLYKLYFGSEITEDKTLSEDGKFNVVKSFEGDGFEKIKLLIWSYSLTIYVMILEDYTGYFNDLKLPFIFTNFKKENIPNEIQDTANSIKESYPKISEIVCKDIGFLITENDNIRELCTKKTYDELKALENESNYKQIFTYFATQYINKDIKLLGEIFVLDSEETSITSFDPILFQYFNFGIKFADEKNNPIPLDTITTQLITIAKNIKNIKKLYNILLKVITIYNCDFDTDKYTLAN